MALPPGEIAVHPTDGFPSHELWLMCDNLQKTLAELESAGIHAAGPAREESWGRATTIALGGGEKLGCTSRGIPVRSLLDANRQRALMPQRQAGRRQERPPRRRPGGLRMILQYLLDFRLQLCPGCAWGLAGEKLVNVLVVNLELRNRYGAPSKE